MVVHVQGKYRNQLLQLHENKRCRIICPVSLLLWWMSVSQVKSGFLFPRWQQLLYPVASWNFFLPVATDDFMEKYCAIMTKCFSTCLHGIVRKADAWTSHGMRRTGILIKIMGGGNDLAVCNSAGLESVGTLKHSSNSTQVVQPTQLKSFIQLNSSRSSID